MENRLSIPQYVIDEIQSNIDSLTRPDHLQANPRFLDEKSYKIEKGVSLNARIMAVDVTQYMVNGIDDCLMSSLKERKWISNAPGMYIKYDIRRVNEKCTATFDLRRSGLKTAGAVFLHIDDLKQNHDVTKNLVESFDSQMDRIRLFHSEMSRIGMSPMNSLMCSVKHNGLTLSVQYRVGQRGILYPIASATYNKNRIEFYMKLNDETEFVSFVDKALVDFKRRRGDFLIGEMEFTLLLPPALRERLVFYESENRN